VGTIELIAATKEKKDKTFTSTHLLHAFVYPLINQGYIDSIETTSRNIELLKNGTFDIQPRRINVTDYTTFPDKTYLISKIEAILKYYSEEDIKWILCNHGGKEISVNISRALLWQTRGLFRYL
jgi:hypothetical protein